MAYISTDEARLQSGAPVDLITDSEIQNFIDIVEPQMEKYMNTRFKVIENIEFLNGSGKRSIQLSKNPLLTVRQLKSGGDTIDPANLNVYKESGIVGLGKDAGISEFVENPKEVTVKYLFGYVEENEDLKTTISGDVSSGDSVTITTNEDLSGTDKITTGNYVIIYGMDGNTEVTKVTSITGTSVTVDKLILSHEDGSTFAKLKTPNFIKRLIMAETAIAVAINAIGGTYTFNTGYSVGDFNVQKGVPYTHWAQSLEKNIQLRDTLMKSIRQRPSIQT